MENRIEIGELFTKVSDSYTITNCQNGFMVEVSGHNAADDWITAKFVFRTADELQHVVTDILDLPRT